MEIYIIRHGQTDWNRVRRLQGSTDIPLNEVGRQMAVETGAVLTEVSFDRIYCSPLRRARETAELICGDRDIEFIVDEQLREVSFGRDEGRKYEEVAADPTSKFCYFFSQPDKYEPCADGETLEHLCERAAEFIAAVIMPLENQFERIMIVAHGAMNKALLMRIRGCDDMADFWHGGLQQNGTAEVVRLENGKFYLE